MSDNKFKKLLATMDEAPKSKRVSKTNRTFYLTEPQVSAFIRFCKFKERYPSEILDELIGIFMDEAKNDLPPGMTVDKNDKSA